MAKLFTLLFGKSKKRMYPIMTDVRHKCENYRDARQNVTGWHDIVPAALDAVDAVVWRQKSSTVGGNRDDGGRSGYIGKNGFNPHT